MTTAAAARRAASEALCNAHRLADELASLATVAEINDVEERLRGEVGRLKDRLKLMEGLVGHWAGEAAKALQDCADRLACDLIAPPPDAPCPFDAPAPAEAARVESNGHSMSEMRGADDRERRLNDWLNSDEGKLSAAAAVEGLVAPPAGTVVRDDPEADLAPPDDGVELRGVEDDALALAARPKRPKAKAAKKRGAR